MICYVLNHITYDILKSNYNLFFDFYHPVLVKIRNAVNGNNSNVSFEGKKVLTASSSGSSRTGSRSNSATRRSTYNGNDGSGENRK